MELNLRLLECDFLDNFDHEWRNNVEMVSIIG